MVPSVVKKGSTEASTQMEREPKDNMSFIPASLRHFSVWVNFSGGLEDLKEKTIGLATYSWLVQEKDKIVFVTHSKLGMARKISSHMDFKQQPTFRICWHTAILTKTTTENVR